MRQFAFHLLALGVIALHPPHVDALELTREDEHAPFLELRRFRRFRASPLVGARGTKGFPGVVQKVCPRRSAPRALT
jgi:hypothetical protein